MIKTYTIIEKTQKVITAKKAFIHYILVDKQGIERKVTAIAKLGWLKKVKSVQAIYHREAPLVEALSMVSVNNTIRVDFSDFNKHNQRISPALSKAKSAVLLKGISNQPSEFLRYSVDPYRLLQLFLMGSLGFAAYLAV